MTYGVLGELDIPVGLGLLRLSTAGRPEEDAAVAVIHRALDGGVRLLDTADSYGIDDDDLHYGERLARTALASWDGPREAVHVVTKVGLARPDGGWRPDVRPERLRTQVEGSLEALGVDRLFMLLLHVKDYRSPFRRTLETLRALQDEGLVEHLGLCNVGIPEIRQAQQHFAVRAVQCELSVQSRASATSGVVAFARALGIPFLAHRPLGGHTKVDKLLKNRAMKPLATKYGVPPHETALATLLDLTPPVIPLIGATRTESVDSSLRALALALDAEDRERLQKISFAPKPEALLDLAPAPAPPAVDLPAGAGPGDDAEVVILMGVQGAGKTTRVEAYEARGYARLNRDLLGGKLADLIPRLAALLAGGQQRVVLDNTYPTWVSRYPVIRTAHAHGVPVRCVHVATPVHEALVNVVNRMLDRYGHLPEPEELKELARTDPNLPPPAAMVAYGQTFEAPRLEDGFAAIDELPFERWPAPPGRSAKGLLLDVDGTLRTTRSGAIYPTDPADVVLLPGRRERLQSWLDDGYQLFFVSNQSGVAYGELTTETADACFARTVELLDLPVTEIRYCPHKAYPASCFCRKPMPGIGLDLIRRHALDAAQLVMVGDMDSDAAFALGIGARYEPAESFFAA